MNDILRDIVIIGTGSAGLTAGIYAARANLKPLILEGLQPGGQLTITTDVENYPGFSDVVQGPWLMDQMKAQALNVGAEIINELVTSVDFSDKLKIIKCDSGKIIKTKSVIICTGAQARWLGIESEKNLMVEVFLLVRLVTVFFIEIRMLRLLVVGTQLLKRHYIYLKYVQK